MKHFVNKDHSAADVWGRIGTFVECAGENVNHGVVFSIENEDGERTSGDYVACGDTSEFKERFAIVWAKFLEIVAKREGGRRPRLTVHTLKWSSHYQQDQPFHKQDIELVI